MSRRARCFVALLAMLALAPEALATETARQILDRRKVRDDTEYRWTNRHQRMTLTLTGPGGERVREITMYERKEPGGEEKSIVYFLKPAEVKGTAFLAFNHKGRRADQWLYLPEIRRIRQITAATRNERFVGTDLTYRDLDLLGEMADWTEDDARSRLTGEEAIDRVACYAIDLTPRTEDIGYARIAVWLGKDDLVPRQIEFSTADGHAKRLRQSAITMVGAIPVAHEIDVETPSAGTRTAIALSDVRFDDALSDDLFTQRALETGPP